MASRVAKLGPALLVFLWLGNTVVAGWVRARAVTAGALADAPWVRALECRAVGRDLDPLFRFQVGIDGLYHPMFTAEGALPVAPDAASACSAVNIHAGVEPNLALYRANLTRLGSDPIANRAVRSATLREAAATFTSPRGGRELRQEVTCAPLRWIVDRQQSEAFLRRQYGPRP